MASFEESERRHQGEGAASSATNENRATMPPAIITDQEQAAVSINRVSVQMPKAFALKDVAECLVPYLLSPTQLRDEAGKFGPYEQGSKFQLDHSNDYWVSLIDEKTFELRCRYDGQQRVIEAMAAMFSARYNKYD